MRASLLPMLRCPRCRAEGSLALTARRSDEREVLEGEITCGACGGDAAVADGIVDMLWDASSCGPSSTTAVRLRIGGAGRAPRHA